MSFEVGVGTEYLITHMRRSVIILIALCFVEYEQRARLPYDLNLCLGILF